MALGWRCLSPGVCHCCGAWDVVVGGVVVDPVLQDARDVLVVAHDPSGGAHSVVVVVSAAFVYVCYCCLQGGAVDDELVLGVDSVGVVQSSLSHCHFRSKNCFTF